MGDAIDENVWEGEDQIDLAQNYRSDEEFEEADSGAEEEPKVVSDKASKKKRKFEEFKMKKKLKLQEGAVEVEEKVDDKKPKKVEVVPLKTEEMLALVEAHRPGNVRPSGDVDFTIEDFTYPGLDESSTTKSAKNKKICPFVRALSANMPGYKKMLLSKVASKEDFGCPLLLVLCSSAIRATQIIKSMCAKLIKCKIAKLFAKHFKVEEQMEMLSKEYSPIALGTPNRVAKLIELGALSLRRTVLVLVDVTPDSKQFNILTLNEVKHDFYRLLYNQILPEKKHLKVALIKE